MLEPASVHRIVRPVFGSAASLGVIGAINHEAVEACFTRLEEIEERFSTYRPTSEISRIRDGLLHLHDAHAETRMVLGICDALYEETSGLFDAWHASMDGRLDPSGFVKGWAIGEAMGVLNQAGMVNLTLGIGGDVAATGGGPRGIGWDVGVVDPLAPGSVMARVLLRDAAIATSGPTERPGHLRDPRTGLPSTSPWVSFSVVGPSIARADTLATIGYLEGEEGLARVDQEPGFGALAMAYDGRLLATEGFRLVSI